MAELQYCKDEWAKILPQSCKGLNVKHIKLGNQEGGKAFSTTLYMWAEIMCLWELNELLVFCAWRESMSEPCHTHYLWTRFSIYGVSHTPFTWVGFPDTFPVTDIFYCSIEMTTQSINYWKPLRSDWVADNNCRSYRTRQSARPRPWKICLLGSLELRCCSPQAIHCFLSDQINISSTVCELCVLHQLKNHSLHSKTIPSLVRRRPLFVNYNNTCAGTHNIFRNSSSWMWLRIVS